MVENVSQIKIRVGATVSECECECEKLVKHNVC